MKKYLLLFFALLFISQSAYSLEIVYPKTNPAVINSPSTFFIGSTEQGSTLRINDVDVKVSPIGAFAQSVVLNFGLNTFKITSGNNTIDFTIERPQQRNSTYVPPALIEYPVMNNFYVNKDNAPLRMTPIDAGVNRLSHLPQGMQLAINGEKGNFYRIYLNSKLCGWIAKADVVQKNCENSEFLPVKINDFKTKENKEFFIYELDLNDKSTPFIIKEENGLTLQLFNIQGQDDCTYTLNIPLKKLIGYDAYYDKHKFILKVRKYPEINSKALLKNIKIAVDAGHGGSEFGAIGCCGDKEKDINLSIAKELEKELGKRGADVIMIRDKDVNVSLSDRVKIVKENNAALLISIHANALPDNADPIKNRGTSVYYYHIQAKPLAEDILTSMTTQLCTQNDKVRQASLALVRPTSSVSVLVEVAYIINPEDYALLLNKDFQSKCAKAIADGIENYILN